MRMTLNIVFETNSLGQVLYKKGRINWTARVWETTFRHADPSHGVSDQVDQLSWYTILPHFAYHTDAEWISLDYRSVRSKSQPSDWQIPHTGSGGSSLSCHGRPRKKHMPYELQQKPAGQQEPAEEKSEAPRGNKGVRSYDMYIASRFATPVNDQLDNHCPPES
jgi:hypothetical protein